MNDRPRHHLEIPNYPKLAAVLLFHLLLVVPACVAQTQFPDTAVGNQTKTWLETFNAGDAAKYK